MSPPLTIVVTGSNRGIGQGIINLLANTPHPQPLHIYATSRSGADLKVQAKPPNKIHYAKLDISDKQSITTFLQTAFTSTAKINVLINNAGINNNSNETPSTAEQAININYQGTKQICHLFLSQGNMKNTPGARIVNVSSTASVLSNYPEATQSRFRTVSSIADIDTLAQEYLTSVRTSSQETAGFGAPPKSYQVSKALMNALTAVLAKENEGVLVNCCCPGWVDTEMGNQVGRPPKTLEEGARIPVRLGIGQLGESGNEDGGLGGETEGVSGRYFANGGVVERGWGRVRGW